VRSKSGGRGTRRQAYQRLRRERWCWLPPLLKARREAPPFHHAKSTSSRSCAGDTTPCAGELSDPRWMRTLRDLPREKRGEGTRVRERLCGRELLTCVDRPWDSLCVWDRQMEGWRSPEQAQDLCERAYIFLIG
jgi:hypothetical protein